MAPRQKRDFGPSIQQLNAAIGAMPPDPFQFDQALRAATGQPTRLLPFEEHRSRTPAGHIPPDHPILIPTDTNRIAFVGQKNRRSQTYTIYGGSTGDLKNARPVVEGATAVKFFQMPLDEHENLGLNYYPAGLYQDEESRWHVWWQEVCDIVLDYIPDEGILHTTFWSQHNVPLDASHNHMVGLTASNGNKIVLVVYKLDREHDMHAVRSYSEEGYIPRVVGLHNECEVVLFEREDGETGCFYEYNGVRTHEAKYPLPYHITRGGHIHTAGQITIREQLAHIVDDEMEGWLHWDASMPPPAPDHRYGACASHPRHGFFATSQFNNHQIKIVQPGGSWEMSSQAAISDWPDELHVLDGKVVVAVIRKPKDHHPGDQLMIFDPDGKLIEAPFFEYDPAGTFKNEYRVFGSTLVVTDGLGQVRWFDPLGFNETFPVSRNFPEKLPSYGFLMHQLTMHRHGYLTAATHIGGGQMSIYRWRPEDFIIPVT